MPTFLSDPPQTVYLMLAAAFLVSGAVWFNRRDKRSLTVFAIIAGAAALLLLIDRLFESPREEAVKGVQAMVHAADTRNNEAFVAQLADKIEYQGQSVPVTITRDQIRKSGFWEALKQFDVHVAAWDFSREDVREIDANTIEIGFLAKGEAKSGHQVPMYFRVTFSRQPDGTMKLSKLATFDPVKRTNEPVTLPFFP